jgi:hypothetical protein
MLKRLRFIALAVVMMLPIAVHAPANAAGFPMTCDIDNTLLTFVQGNSVTMLFRVSVGPAASGLQPGQCAFEDRAVRASEPHALCFSANVTSLSFTGASLATGGALFGGPGAKIVKAAMYGPPLLITYVVRNTTSGGQSCFVIDSLSS